MFTREVMTDLRDRIGRCDAVEELLDGIHRDFLGNTARDELDQQRMEPTRSRFRARPRSRCRFANNRNTTA